MLRANAQKTMKYALDVILIARPSPAAVSHFSLRFVIEVYYIVLKYAINFINIIWYMLVIPQPPELAECFVCF